MTCPPGKSKVQIKKFIIRQILKASHSIAITGETGTTSQPSAGIAGQDKPGVKDTRVKTIAKDSPAESPGFEVFFSCVCLLLVYSVRKRRFNSK